jgi:hypothetical protein
MSELYGYDFNDPQVRELVLNNHVPTEQVITSSGGTVLHPVICEKCHAPWPCPAISACRDYQAARETVYLKSGSDTYNEPTPG